MIIKVYNSGNQLCLKDEERNIFGVLNASDRNNIDILLKTINSFLEKNSIIVFVNDKDEECFASESYGTIENYIKKFYKSAK